MRRNKLYGILLIACLAGYAWLGYNLLENPEGDSYAVGVCLVRETTGVPCPSCGTTRAVLAFFRGDVLTGLYLNPFGVIVLLIMVTGPLWITADVINGRDSLFRVYHMLERKLSIPRIAIPLVSLVLLNWIWNIYKGL